MSLWRIALPVMSWLAPCFAAPAKVGWRCADPVWLREPSFESGVLIGRVASTCKVTGLDKESLARLHAFIKKDVETSGRFQFHQAARPDSREGIAGLLYDATDKVQEAGESLSIRQDMFLGLSPGKRLLYETFSTDVKADGHAGYLQKVVFRTELTPQQITFENQVQVERPWYAFPPVLFRAVGTKITKEKFLKARDTLLQYFSPHIY